MSTSRWSWTWISAPSSGATSTKPDRSRAAPTSPHGGVGRRPGRRRVAPACRRPRQAPTRATSGAPCARARRHCPRSGNSSCSGSRSTTPLSTMPPSDPACAAGQVLGRLADGDRATAFQGTQRDRATGLDPVRRRAARRQGFDERALPAVGVHDVAAGRAREHVRRHGSHPRAELPRRDEPRRTVHRPVLGRQPRLERGDPGREEAEGLDHVAHRLFELRLAAFGRPPGTIPPRAQAAEAAGSPSAGTALGLERVRERRRTGVVRPVAIAEMRERRQEVPRVAALGCQTREGLAQRLGRSGLVVLRHLLRGSVAAALSLIGIVELGE